VQSIGIELGEEDEGSPSGRGEELTIVDGLTWLQNFMDTCRKLSGLPHKKC
jgi:hypothetical protein